MQTDINIQSERQKKHRQRVVSMCFSCLSLRSQLTGFSPPPTPTFLFGGTTVQARDSLSYVFSDPSICKLAMADIEKEVKESERIEGDNDSLCRY